MRPAPLNGALAAIVEAWLKGRPDALLSWIDDLGAHPISSVARIGWELSTALGVVVQPPQLRQEDRVVGQSLAFQPPLMTGGAPRHLAEVAGTQHAWISEARKPLSQGGHREAIRATHHALLAGEHPFPDSAYALLRHHTDAAVDFLAGRPLYETLSPELLAAELEPVTVALSDVDAFTAHLNAGVSSPSLARRDLSWRLLRLPR